MIVSDSDASSENAVDAVLDFSADVLAVDSPTEVDIARSDNGGRVCGGSLRTSAHRFSRRRTVLPGVLRTSVTRAALRKGTRRPTGWWNRGTRPGSRRLA